MTSVEESKWYLPWTNREYIWPADAPHIKGKVKIQETPLHKQESENPGDTVPPQKELKIREINKVGENPGGGSP